MIVDAFLFFDELDMLRFRLQMLADHVDHFVLVESPLTFQGNPKPLHYIENAALFAEWNDRITHVVAPAVHGETVSPWTREDMQREAIAIGLQWVGAKGDDLVLLSDVDEIWRPEALRTPEEPFLVFEQVAYVYNLRWRFPLPWNGTVVTRAETLRHAGPNPFVTMRSCRLDSRPGRIPNGGWHLSWFGGPKANVAKFQAFSHTDLGDIAPSLADGSRAAEGVHVEGTKLVPASAPPPWAHLAPEAWW